MLRTNGFFSTPEVIHPCDAHDLFVSKLAMGTVNKLPELASINEQNFAAAVAEAMIFLIAGEKPQAGRNLRRIEELAGEGDHAVDEIGFDDVLADFAFAGLVRGHRAVGEYEAGDAGGGEAIAQW